MKTLIPNRLLFRFEFELPYRAKPPKINGTLTGWSDAELLPNLGDMDGEEQIAPVWSCWSEDGIYIAAHVTGKRSAPHCEPKQFWKGDNLRLMLDMRDTRTIKRATKFCHHFYFLPTGGQAKSKPATKSSEPGAPATGPIAGLAPINRAKENAPPIAPDRIRVASSVLSAGYKLEAHIPADCLHGFDPDQHRRIGFYYILEDRDLGRQSFTIGDDLPWHVDPSLWATAVLEK
jgi:hypothetical protein